MAKILTKPEIAILTALLNSDAIADVVPDGGASFVQQWQFVGCLMVLAYEAGFGLKVEVENETQKREYGLTKWAVQAFHKDGGPTGVADEVRCFDDDLKIGRQAALALIDLEVHREKEA